MVQDKPLDGRCINELENGNKCVEEIKGQGARLYCPDCRVAAQEKADTAKKERDRKRRADRRNEDREGDNLYHVLYDHGLTKPQLLPLIEHAKKPLEECTHRDDFFEEISKKIIGITLRISNPLADLPRDSATARDELSKLHKSLNERQQNYGPDSTFDQLRLAIWATERDVGRKNTAKALGHISGRAKKVLRLMHKHNELYGFIHALLVRVEIFRILYFATSQHEYLTQALTWLKYAEDVCDQALARLPVERKQLAGYLRSYVELVRVRLAFDAKELDVIDTHIQEAHNRVSGFADAHGESPIVATGRFMSEMNHAERQLLLSEYDRSSEYVAKAELILPMEHRSIESQHRIAIVKTHIAIACNRADREKCLDFYKNVLKRNPCPEYREGLRELEKIYEIKVPDVDLLTREERFVYIDTNFSQISPHKPAVRALKGVGEVAIPRAEESEVMVSV